MRQRLLPLLSAGLLSGCVSTTTVTRHPDGSETTVTTRAPDAASVQALSAAASLALAPKAIAVRAEK